MSREGSGQDVTVSLGAKPIVMVVVLAAAGPSGVSRRTIRDLLWPGTSDANASNSLRQALFRTRHLLGADAVRQVGGRLVLATPVPVDLLEAEALFGEGRLSEGLAKLTGPVGVSLDVAGDALRIWTRELRARIEHRLLDALSSGWNDAMRGPAPESLAPGLARARNAFGDLPDLLWMELELAARLGDAGHFEQVERQLATRAHGVRAPATVAQRITRHRHQLRDRLSAGLDAVGQPIHAAELRALEATWRAARAGTGSVVGLVGDTGTGRTWLLRELGRRCLADGARTVPLVALRSTSELPTACLRDLTVALRGYRGAAGMRPAFAAVIDRLNEGMLAPSQDAIPAVHDLMAAVAAEGPVLVSLDDAHRYDVRMLTRLLRQVQEVPVPGLLVVAVLRSDEQVRGIPCITVGRAGPEGIRALWGSMARLPRADWVPPLVELLHRVSDGRPGYASQAILQLYRDGHLQIVDDRWTLTSALPEALTALASTAA